MRDVFVAVLLVAGIVIVGGGPLLLAHHMAVRNHKDQFKATGAPEFDMPTARDVEREEIRREPVQPWAAQHTEPLPRVLVDTDTGELVQLDPDGVPLTEADVSARTPSTSLTVDPDRLAAILELEQTGEWPISPGTWVEIGAAEEFVRNPLTALVMPPEHLVLAAGSPTMATTFKELMGAAKISYDWRDGASDFAFWTRELGESWTDDGSSDVVLAAAGFATVS